MNNKPNNYVVAKENTTKLKTSARRALVANMIMQGSKKAEIMEYLATNYGYEPKQCVSEYRQGMSYLYLYTEETKDAIRNMNIARLERILDQLEDDNTMGSYKKYSAMIKAIDTENKTAGVYNPDEQVKNVDNEFTINIGTIDTTNQPVEDIEPEEAEPESEE